MVHRFGGRWTDEKLGRLNEYLVIYNTALKNQPFRRLYIDAFAGTGSRSVAPVDHEPRLALPDVEEIAKGSAQIALGIDPPFHEYIFIERNIHRFNELSKMVDNYPRLRPRIQLFNDDANLRIKHLCNTIDWRKTRGVLFLDPYGMQVDWLTIESIAATCAIDLWYLVPTGMGISRMTPRDGAFPEGWENRLDRMIGDKGWRDAFYDQDNHPDLFGREEQSARKLVNVRAIEKFFIMRLKSIFPAVVPHGLTLGPRGNPLYSLIFACSNPDRRATALALKLARAVLK